MLQLTRSIGDVADAVAGTGDPDLTAVTLADVVEREVETARDLYGAGADVEHDVVALVGHVPQRAVGDLPRRLARQDEMRDAQLGAVDDHVLQPPKRAVGAEHLGADAAARPLQPVDPRVGDARRGRGGALLGRQAGIEQQRRVGGAEGPDDDRRPGLERQRRLALSALGGRPRPLRVTFRAGQRVETRL